MHIHSGLFIPQLKHQFSVFPQDYHSFRCVSCLFCVSHLWVGLLCSTESEEVVSLKEKKLYPEKLAHLKIPGLASQSSLVITDGNNNPLGGFGGPNVAQAGGFSSVSSGGGFGPGVGSFASAGAGPGFGRGPGYGGEFRRITVFAALVLAIFKAQ